MMEIVHHTEIDSQGEIHSTLCLVEGDELIIQVEDNEAGRYFLLKGGFDGEYQQETLDEAFGTP
jgi:hypothetical protein